MFLHVGSDVMICMSDIIAIFDLENTTVSRITREFLTVSEEEEFIVNVSEEDLPRSFILTEVKGMSRIYISPISSATLNKRFNSYIESGMVNEI